MGGRARGTLGRAHPRQRLGREVRHARQLRGQLAVRPGGRAHAPGDQAHGPLGADGDRRHARGLGRRGFSRGRPGPPRRRGLLGHRRRVDAAQRVGHGQGERAPRASFPSPFPCSCPTPPPPTWSSRSAPRRARTRPCRRARPARRRIAHGLRHDRHRAARTSSSPAAPRRRSTRCRSPHLRRWQALSKRNDDPAGASRPYDVTRDGFVLGEGSGIVVLESEEHAKARGARIYARLLGIGMHVRRLSHRRARAHGRRPDARHAVRARRRAGSSINDIVHVNAHATSTPVGDPIEARGIAGAHGRAHAAGAGLGDQVDDWPPARRRGRARVGVHHQGAARPQGAADDQRRAARPRPADQPGARHPADLPATGDLAAINNSFGFGGHNVALVFATP